MLLQQILQHQSGKIVGNFDGYSDGITANRISWVKDTPASGYQVNSTWGTYADYTLQQMSTNNDLLNLLNGEAGSGLWARNSSINNGYPYLVNNRP